MNLTEALETATDRISPPGLGEPALDRLHARRARRRRVVVAAAAVLVLVVGTPVVVGQVADGDRTAPLRTPTQGPDPDAPPSDDVGPDSGLLPRWDPFTVPDQPVRSSLLPREIEPPGTAASVTEDPMTRAVLAWPTAGADLRLLDADGSWRVVPDTADAVAGTLGGVVRPALTDDGRSVAMATNEGLLVVDVSTGDDQMVPWPRPLAGPWDDPPALLWLPGDDEVAVLHWRRTWVLGLDGSFREAPYGGSYGGGLAVDPDGAVLERRWEHGDLRVFEGDRVVSTAPFPYWGERPAAGHGLFALTGGGSGLPGDGGPLVVDAATGALVAYAPIRDRGSVYSDNGHLTVKGFLDADTLLLLVAPMDFGTMDAGDETWHLVTWDIRSGQVERLAQGSSEMRAVAVATGLLAHR